MLQITLWTAGIVVLTLLVNAPLMPVLLKWTGLAKVSPVKRRIRAKAARALQRYAVQALQELQADQDEMLRGRPLDGCKLTGDALWSNLQSKLALHLCQPCTYPVAAWPS